MILAAAQAGVLPTPPNFSAETHKRFRGKLADLVALAAAGDVAGLKAYPTNPISSSPKALDRYRNLCLIALAPLRLGNGQPIFCASANAEVTGHSSDGRAPGR